MWWVLGAAAAAAVARHGTCIALQACCAGVDDTTAAAAVCHQTPFVEWIPTAAAAVAAATLCLFPLPVRNSPSSFYLYRVFNLGYNFIVFFVNLFIIFLMMGAFLWLVVAYGANLSIKGGVL